MGEEEGVVEHVRAGPVEPAGPVGHGTLAPNPGWRLVDKSRSDGNPEMAQEVGLIAVHRVQSARPDCHGSIYGQSRESDWAEG